MRSLIRVSVVALCATGLFACGGSRIAPNREAAADAAFAASRGVSGAQGMVRAALASPVGSLSSTTTADCPHGGTAALEIDITSIDPDTGYFEMGLTYDNCNYDGETAMTGTLNVGYVVVTDGGTSVDVQLTLDGRVEFAGAISDFVQMDLTQTVSVTSLSATSGTVSVSLDGSVTTSSGTYTYDQETLNVTAGGIDIEG